MHNTTYIRLYILTKVDEIQKEANQLSIDNTDTFSRDRVFELQGKLELLKEMFEELNLSQPKEEKVKIHDDI